MGPGDGRDDRRPVRLSSNRTSELRGTFIPAYALNNFLARVPILGTIIGGGQNEGIFGMTYEVVGPPGNATLRVMPMSVFAPGIFAEDVRVPQRGRPDVGAALFAADAIAPASRQPRESGVSSMTTFFPWARGPHAFGGPSVKLYTGFSSTCFFLPSESLITPSGVRSFRLSVIFSSATAASFTFSPPPLIWRRASPFEATRPVFSRKR